MPEQLGHRLARLRSRLGWTQQELADRIAVSRVAISHFEMGLQVPSERTVALLAGVFKTEPRDLVANTYYPPAKADRLPAVAARYTELEKELCLLARDLEWSDRLAAQPHGRHLLHATLHGWLARLAELLDDGADRRTAEQLRAARSRVQAALHTLQQPADEPG